MGEGVSPSPHRNGFPVDHSFVISDPLARELGLPQVFSLIFVFRSREHVYCVVLVSSPWEHIYYGGSILPFFLLEIGDGSLVPGSREHGSDPLPKDHGTGRCFLTVFMIPKSWVSDPGFHSLSTPSTPSLGLFLRSDMGGGCLTGNIALGLATKGSGYCCPDQVEGDLGGPDLWIVPSTPFCFRFAKSVDDKGINGGSRSESVAPILSDGRHNLLNFGASFPMGLNRASYVAKAAAEAIDASADTADAIDVASRRDSTFASAAVFGQQFLGLIGGNPTQASWIETLNPDDVMPTVANSGVRLIQMPSYGLSGLLSTGVEPGSPDPVVGRKDRRFVGNESSMAKEAIGTATEFDPDPFVGVGNGRGRCKASGSVIARMDGDAFGLYVTKFLGTFYSDERAESIHFPVMYPVGIVLVILLQPGSSILVLVIIIRSELLSARWVLFGQAA